MDNDTHIEDPTHAQVCALLLMPAWKCLVKTCNVRIESLQASLETAPLEQIQALQGELKGLRYMVGLPSIILERLEEQKDGN